MKDPITNPGCTTSTYVPLVTTPACANMKRTGPCFGCAYCHATVCGPEWWLMPDREFQAAMLAASVAHENARKAAANGVNGTNGAHKVWSKAP